MTGAPATAAPLIVTATFARDDHGWLEGLRRKHFPVDRNQVPVHLTLFHHLPPSLEAELRDRLAHAVRLAAPYARIVGIMDLGQGTALRIESAELEAMRAELAAAFRGLLTPQDQAGWRPHVTIQNKVSRAEAIALQLELAPELSGRPLTIRGLASWRYLGGPWERVRDYPFRG